MNTILEISENIKNADNFKGTVELNRDLFPFTTMHVGGKAAVFVSPEDEESFSIALSETVSHGRKYFILGGGSNVVFDDKGFDGVVISTLKFNTIEIVKSDDEYVAVKCGAGVKTGELVNFFTEHKISGLECFAGLPGTCGGACYMNARCYGVDFSASIVEAEYYNFTENVNSSDKNIAPARKIYHNIENGQDWDYKKSPFMKDATLILSVTVKGKLGKTRNEITAECNKYIADRNQKGHFMAYSAGSVFKNNRDYGVPSGQLIDEAGLKGYSIGGAQIAPWHGNFIINNGDAGSQDIKNLVKLAQDKIFEKHGFLLEPEIIFP